MRLKIRTKLILSFFTPIIPLVAVVIIVSVYILNNLYDEAQRLDAISQERMKVADLRLSLDRGLMPVNDYIITGDRKYIEDFKAISIDLERGLKELEEILPPIAEIGFDDEVKEEVEILKDVNSSWQNIKEISLKIFTIPAPVGNKEAARLMEEMDYKWGYPAIERLGRWREIDLEEYNIVLEKHNRAWMRLWTIIIIVSLSFPILCLLYILYYSSQFVKSIDALKNAAKIIADGNLDEHIDLRTGDEIEELSALFNSMADNLKVSYTSLEDRVAERTRELKESEERYRGIFEKTTNAMVIFDSETWRFEDVNQAAIDLYGYTKEEFLSLTVTDMSAEVEKTRVAVQAGVAGELTHIPLRYHKKKDGTVISLEIFVGTFLSKGRKKGFAVMVDHTERKKAEDKLREQLDELERFQKVAVKREFRIREFQDKVKELRDENESLNVRMTELEEKLRKAYGV